MLSALIAKSLPRPTDDQWEAFAEHLITVHSWYKHLPLFDGGEFVVFLAPDAGDHYPLQHPKLPTENTTDGYRRAFGHLDYMWRSRSDEPFDRDGPPTIQLDEELLDIGRFNLFPYVSNEFCWSVHEADVVRIRNGVTHPHAAAILNAYDAEQSMDQYWSELPQSDRDIIGNIDDTEAALQEGLFPDSILRYLKLENLTCKAYRNLQELEISKLNHCVNSIRQWLG